MAIDMGHIARKNQEQLEDVYKGIRRLFELTALKGGGTVRGFDIDEIVVEHGFSMLPRNNGIMGRIVKDLPGWEIIREKSPWLPCVDYKVVPKSQHSKQKKFAKGEGKLSDFGGAYASPEYRYSQEPIEYESFMVDFSPDGEIINLIPVN